MWTDVVDYRDFYETQLGQVARQSLRLAIRELWPDAAGKRLLGLGYATPYLAPFLGEAERVFAFMPATRGVLAWPATGTNHVALVEENELPLPDYSVDRVLLVHALEHTHNLPAVMSEVWRVLTGEGRLICVTPNRMGFWARADGTPLGWGHPYSGSQLSRLLRDHGFIPTRTRRALYAPPTRLKTVLGWASALERMGPRLFPRVSGVVMVEAGKQIYAASQPRQTRKARRPVLVQVPKAASRSPHLRLVR